MKIKWSTFFKMMVTIALPIALQNLLAQTASMVDTIMIGSLGELAVASVGICSQIASLFFSTYYGFANGAIIFFSQYWGSQDEENDNLTFGTAFLSILVVSVLFGLVCVIDPRFLLGIYTDKANIIELAAPYIRIVGFAFPLQAMACVFSFFLRSSDRVNQPLYCSLVGLVVNFVINFTLIYGRFGFPKLGIPGAAIGTLASAIVNFILLFIILIKSECSIRLHITKIFHLSIDFMKMYYLKCAPIVCNEILYGVGQMIINIVMGHQNESAIAAMAAFRVCEGFVFSFFGGLTNATAVVVGNDVGSGRLEDAYGFVKKARLFTPIVTFCIVGTCLILNHPLFTLFGLGEQALSYGKYMLMVYLIFGSIRTCNYTMGDSFRAGGEPLYGTIMEIGSLFLISVPITWTTGMILHLPFLLVFMFVYSDEVFKFFADSYYLKTGKWVKPVTKLGKEALPGFMTKLQTKKA